MYLRVHLIAAFPPPCLYPPTPSPGNLCGNWSEVRERLWEWAEYKEGYGVKHKNLGRGTGYRDTIRQMCWSRSTAEGDFQVEHIQPSSQTFPALWPGTLYWEKLRIFNLEVLTKQWRWGCRKNLYHRGGKETMCGTHVAEGTTGELERGTCRVEEIACLPSCRTNT